MVKAFLTWLEATRPEEFAKIRFGSEDRGRAFLERGIRNNPNDWSLHRSYASLLRDPNKLLAFRDRDQCLLDAAKAYQMAIALGGNQPMQMA